MNKFKLEKLLTHRRWIEEKKERELAEVVVQLNKEDQKLDSYRSLENKYQGMLNDRQIKGTTALENNLYAVFLTQLSTRIKAQQEILVQVKSQVDQKREELLITLKDRKLLEKLKEKKNLLFKKDLLIKDRKFLDELGVNKFNQKQ